jgi:hypothetical protein
MLPDWRHQDLRELGGTVWTGGTAMREPYPDAVVYARRWPTGKIMETRTDEKGRFLFAGATSGTFEVAVCAMGWNPWRGTVRVAASSPSTPGDFTIELGQ